ncbi:MAG TPA: thioredoxin domain-containing protein, partial [Tepidisphaeraceae bacterium]|nr:thioredoxin domain-containing protein [Tepidisphaeraceae bacterium]
MSPAPAHTNRLIRETSPYLLQHAHNPVDWYPWGPEAFDKARREDKPIFLSVGYSTCYWCHVMERQSFENAAVAAVMNEHVVSVKVDREERPDVDQLYMTAVQILTRQGGWPMSVFLTPDLKPFFAGTYFPPADTHGRPGFPRVVQSLAGTFKTRREQVQRQAEELTRMIESVAEPRRPDHPLTVDLQLVEQLLEQSSADFDSCFGGFGGAPKFPRQTLIEALLRYAASPDATEDGQTMRQHAVYTLDSMADGGIRDHLGGGFHRYSTDEKWLVPHFEIMLYDQAMLAVCYAEAYRQTRETRHARVCRGICDFVLREMTDPAGPFYTAFDAEVDGMEGQNYLWTPEQAREALSETPPVLSGRTEGARDLPPPHAVRELKRSLQALAAPADAQLRMFPAGVAKADELALDYNHWLDVVSGWGFELSEGQQRDLADVDRALETMSGPNDHWSESALQSDPAWANVRDLARRALAAIEHVTDSPEPSSFPSPGVELFLKTYGLHDGPNFADPHHGNGQPDQNILFLPRPLAHVAKELNTTESDLDAKLAPMRRALYDARKERKQPLLDTKVLTSWNALMIRALAFSGGALDEPRYTAAAACAAEWLWLNHRRIDGTLKRTSRPDAKPAAPADHPPADIPGSLDDYAFLAQSLLELHRATGDPRWRTDAAALVDILKQRFLDPNSGGFYFTEAGAADLVVRQKPASDSPLPSGNAVAAMCLIELGEPALARQTIAEFAQVFAEHPDGASSTLQAALEYLERHPAFTVSPTDDGRAHVEAPATPDELARAAVTLSAAWASPTELRVRASIKPPFHLNANRAAQG